MESVLPYVKSKPDFSAKA